MVVPKACAPHLEAKIKILPIHEIFGAEPAHEVEHLTANHHASAGDSFHFRHVFVSVKCGGSPKAGLGKQFSKDLCIEDLVQYRWQGLDATRLQGPVTVEYSTTDHPGIQ
jgi:hypothetical protein